jgi:small subunit ribosomal protein S14
MAKKGRIQREESLKSSILSVKNKRAELSKKIILLEGQKRETSDAKLAMQYSKEIFSIMNYLQKTRGMSYIRGRNRCQITGRTRGYLGVFGMCRGVVRSLASFGLLNGVKKSSHS